VEVTEVRIKLLPASAVREDRLRAFCTVTFDDAFVVRDLKIIEGNNGLFVAMPSRKLTGRCDRCDAKNALRAWFCNECGAPFRPRGSEERGRTRYYTDIAHPIHAAMRRRLEQRVLEAYREECERAKQPGYVPETFPDLDYDEPPAAEAQA
jgi:stage V sporulation protein G